MRHLLLLLFLATGLNGCVYKKSHSDNKNILDNSPKTYEGDTITYLSRTDNKIEILKPNRPIIDYMTKEEAYGGVLDGVYIKDPNPLSMKDGELVVYNRFYEIDERKIFKDSMLVLNEEYTLGKITSLFSYNYKDSIFITKYFYENGNPRTTEINKQNYETEKFSWHKNGKLATHCIRKKLVEICNFWTEEGYFVQRQRYTYANVNASITMTQEIIDRKNKLIKKIQ
jgi:hypothetical protein